MLLVKRCAVTLKQISRWKVKVISDLVKKSLFVFSPAHSSPTECLWVRGVQWPWTMVFGKCVGHICVLEIWYWNFLVGEFMWISWWPLSPRKQFPKKGTAKHYVCLTILIIFPLKINPHMSTCIHIRNCNSLPYKNFHQFSIMSAALKIRDIVLIDFWSFCSP